jgi:hypothetical protein
LYQFPTTRPIKTGKTLSHKKISLVNYVSFPHLAAQVVGYKTLNRALAGNGGSMDKLIEDF